MQQTERKPLFDLGQLVATPGALAALEKSGQSPMDFLARHVTGDWGELCEEDRKENQFSLEKGFRLLRFKKPARDPFAESKEKLRSGLAEETALEPSEASALPEKTPTQWLDLVVFLLSACKRASQKVKKRVALETYRTAAMARGRSGVRTVGSIIDTTGEIISDLDQKKAG